MRRTHKYIDHISRMYMGMILALLLLTACRHEIIVYPVEEEQRGDTCHTEVLGFYLLNEGNMGSNKASLDYYDYTTATYKRNIYAEANPNVIKDLGDVGNDIKIYGNRLYAVINVSNKIEVMDASTAVRIGQINIPNCRYLRFKDGYGYVTSYAGPVMIDKDHAQIGYVARFDTANLAIVDTCFVGFQPDELEIVGDKLYVANSGGYMVPNYENTVSVIDLTTFKEIYRIEVAYNLHHLRKDNDGGLWVTSRGDYYGRPSRLYYIDTHKDALTDSVLLSVNNLWLDGDSLYICSSEFNYESFETEIAYGIVNTKTHAIVSTQIITDGTETEIALPYGIMVNPVTKDFYITDARNYVTPGYLHCYGQDGVRKWKVRTGEIPAHFALLYRND